jgi:hypothetical protein
MSFVRPTLNNERSSALVFELDPEEPDFIFFKNSFTI